MDYNWFCVALGEGWESFSHFDTEGPFWTLASQVWCPLFAFCSGDSSWYLLWQGRYRSLSVAADVIVLSCLLRLSVDGEKPDLDFGSEARDALSR